MIIKVTKDKVSIEQNKLNHYGEYNVNECNFEFDEHFNSILVKRAIFTSKNTNKTIEIDIINNKCVVPSDILLETYDQITLGVYGYNTEGEELLIRYSPEPTYFTVYEGSYREGAEQPEIITPTQYDMYSKALQEGLAEVDKRLDDVEKQGDYASEQGDYAKEQGDYAKEQGTNAKSVAEETEKKAQEGAFDGKSLEFVWEGTKLGVRLEGQEEYHFVDLQGKQGEIGATGEPFKIKMTYASVSEMNADFGNMQFGDYVMIASSVNEEDNAKLYTRGESAWIFISDFSGAMGIRGETGLTPNIQIGEVKTLEAGSQAKVTRSGSNEEPVFNFELPKGDKGDDYVLTEEDKVEIGEKVNTEYEKRIEENEKDISELEATIDILTNTNTAKGELVHITDALPLPTFENKVDGNVEQETTKGTNEFNAYAIKNPDIVVEDNGKTITMPIVTSGNGSTVTDSTLAELCPNLKAGDEAYLYFKRNLDANKNSSIYLIGTSSSWYVDRSKIITQEDLDGKVLLYGNRFMEGETEQCILTDFQITKVQNAPWEKFTNGASPNPTNQQEIEVVEGYNEFNSFIATKLGGQVGELQIEKDGTFVVSGNAGSNNYFGLEETLGELCPGLKDGDNAYLNLETTSTVKIIYFGESWRHNEPKTITQKMLDTRVVIYGGYNQTDKIKVQVSKTPNKPYLPYGSIAYKIQGDNYFDISKVVSGDNIKNNNNGTLTVNASSTSASVGAPKPNTLKDYCPNLKVGKTYYFNAITTGSTKAIYLLGSNQSWFFGNPRTITQTDLDSQVYWYASGLNTTATISDIIISEENIPYEPYKEQITYLDLKGNWAGKVTNSANETFAKDILVTDKKHLWLVKNIGKYTLGNAYNLPTATLFGTTFKYGSFSVPNILIKARNYNFVCDRVHKANEQYSPYGGYLNNNTFVVMADEDDTLESFNAKLNGSTLYYPTATTETIYLGELPEPIKTFEGVNNIQLLANIPTEIEVKYALDVKKYFDNKLTSIQEQIL